VKEKVNIIISDGQTLVREGMNCLLSGVEDIVVRANATTNEEAKNMIENMLPDVAIMDTRKSDPTGEDLIQRMIKDLPNVAFVLILDVKADEERFFNVIKSGANGCFDNASTSDDLKDIIRTAGNKGYPVLKYLLNPGVAAKVLQEFEKNEKEEYLEKILSLLTVKEQEIMQHISNKEPIDSSLEINRYLENIRIKLVNNRRYLEIFNVVKAQASSQSNQSPPKSDPDDKPGAGGIYNLTRF